MASVSPDDNDNDGNYDDNIDGDNDDKANNGDDDSRPTFAVPAVMILAK